MSGETFSELLISDGCWSLDVSYVPQNENSGSAVVTVNSVATGPAMLTGMVSSENSLVEGNFPVGGELDPNPLDLFAVAEISGGILFRDASSEYYLFSSSPLQQGASYETVVGWNNFNSALQLEPACFTDEAILLTPSGEVSVTDLRPGDLLCHAEGPILAIRWIGTRKVASGNHRNRPVLIARHAFGWMRPHTDLKLSPDHAVYYQSRFIPVRHLINESTITWPDAVEPTVYYHIETRSHAAIKANGLAVETYLDTGNRSSFAIQHWEVGAVRGSRHLTWKEHAYSELIVSGVLLERARMELDGIATKSGFHWTNDARLSIMVEGEVRSAIWDGSKWEGVIPPGTQCITLISKSTTPADVHAGIDIRRLGVAVRRISIADTDLSFMSNDTREGWHAAEGAWRWTNGEAIFRNALLEQGGLLLVETVPMLKYVHAEELPATAEVTYLASVRHHAKIVDRSQLRVIGK